MHDLTLQWNVSKSHGLRLCSSRDTDSITIFHGVSNCIPCNSTKQPFNESIRPLRIWDSFLARRRLGAFVELPMAVVPCLRPYDTYFSVTHSLQTAVAGALPVGAARSPTRRG